MPLSPLIEQHLKELSQHPHIDDITEIKPLVYKVTYWPRNLDSLYAQIPYTLKLTIPEAYPQKAPFITFLQKIYHLNIHPVTGQLVMSILTQDWSPFLNLKAIINSLDEILQQPDQNNPATPSLLEQYQNDITRYVENVKDSLQQIMVKEKPQKEANIYTEQEVEEIIQVDDFSQYKIIKPETNQNSRQRQTQQFQLKTDFNHIPQSQKHQYSFNYDAAQIDTYPYESQIHQQHSSNFQQQSQKTQIQENKKGQNFLSIKNGKKNEPPLQLKPPLLKNDSELNSPTQIKNKNKKSQNENNPKHQQRSSFTKYQDIINNSHQFFKAQTQQNQQYQSQNQQYQNLKLNMTRCKQLITIFSEQLNQMQQNISNSKSQRIKKLLQEKCMNLEQMIVQLFDISEKTRLKLMQKVRKELTQYQ